MVERSDQIEKHIASTRSELGSNLQELEDKVKQAADWRTYFDRNPMMLMGLALGGGVLLGTMTGSNGGAAQEPPKAGSPFAGRSNAPVADTWYTLKGALIGLAGSKVRTLLDEVLPGFDEQYRRMERDTSASASPTTQGREFEPSAHRRM
jgi:hypothetical protein